MANRRRQNIPVSYKANIMDATVMTEQSTRFLYKISDRADRPITLTLATAPISPDAYPVWQKHNPLYPVWCVHNFIGLTIELTGRGEPQ